MGALCEIVGLLLAGVFLLHVAMEQPCAAVVPAGAADLADCFLVFHVVCDAVGRAACGWRFSRGSA